MQSILIVDDLESIHEMLEAVIQPIGYKAAFATDGESALQKLREEHFDIVLTDINMEPMDGLALLAQIKEADPEAIVLMMSGYATIENATQSLKLGAFDYITKPFKVDQLMAAINRAAAERRKRLESGEGSASQNSILLSGDSDLAKKFRERLRRAAKRPAPLLITGETGSQKAKIAGVIRAQSDAADAPMVAMDAKRLGAEELRAQLFDPDGGPGEAVRSAAGGVLFVANVDAVPSELQAELSELLRQLKGETHVIFSSSHDLEQLVEVGAFQEALYFRIANNPLQVPPLRERTEDIAALARAYFAQEHLPFNALSKGATDLLQGYRWPGNYTEFQEILSAAAACGEGQTIQESDLPEKISDTSSWPNLADYLAEQAERYKKGVLKACQSDSAKAAQVLGIDPSEL